MRHETQRWRRLIPVAGISAISLLALLPLACGKATPGQEAQQPASAQVAASPQAPAADVEAVEPAADVPPALGGEALLARGLALYEKHCSSCHGAQGLGDGPAAYLLYPKPRNFAEAQFRITSVQSGLPTDADLMQTLRRGMPGSAMPPWGHLPETDLQALVAAVRQLALDAKVSQLVQRSRNMTPERALELSRSLLEPGAAINIPPEPPAAQISLERGRELYTASCADCHGADGRARDKGDLKDSSGFPIHARDFTQGIFKGGAEPIELARRIAGGMPGSPMPGQEMPAEDLWSLVQYVQTMITPGAQDRVLQNERRLIAAFARGALPDQPDSPAWAAAPATFLPVMPLWWRDDRIEGVTLRAVHDGARIAIQLSWADPTRNDLPSKPELFTDGAAIQLSSIADPPFFAMGDRSGEVSIWHWKASWQRDAASGFASMKEIYPNLPEDDWGEPRDQIYITAAAARNPLSETQHPSPVENLAARGQGTVTSQPPVSQIVSGAGCWRDGEWQVVFVRDLAPAGASELKLEPGEDVSIAFAVWDGEAGDRNGQKGVTIWHRLVLEERPSVDSTGRRSRQ